MTSPRLPRLSPLASASVLLAIGALATHAQPETRVQPETRAPTDVPAPAQELPDPLRGPSVETRELKTLVHQGMTRGFARVEGRPEAAALELLELDAETAARARAVVDARATELAMLLVEEIDSVREITDRMTAGDGEGARRTLLALWERFEPGMPRSPMLDGLSAVLDDDAMAEMNRLLDEYWDAWIESHAPATDAQRAQIQNRLAFELFQQEVREAYDISLRRYRQALDAIYNATDPTPEQRSAIRDLVIQHIKDTRLSATPEQRRAATRRIYDLLDSERQAKLFDYILQVALPG